MAVKKAIHVADPVAVQVNVNANYLAIVIDGRGLGIKRAGKIERRVSAMAVEKAVIDAVNISVIADNLSRLVNA
jgi:hypothetical protein